MGPRRLPSLVSTVLLIAAVAAGTWPERRLSVTVYALSFWHYYVYWLAYRYGAVALDVLKRDAVVAKSVSLALLGYAYLSVPPDMLSFAVVAGGFLLNAAGARALGSDRTYYGHEVAGLQRRVVTEFPYSWVPHPMLLGNMAAFGGTLLNARFREDWWPLACTHVALNLGLLVMETAVTPLRGTRARSAGIPLPAAGIAAAAGAAGGAALAHSAPWTGAIVGAAVCAHATVMYFCYSSPPSNGGFR